MKILLAEDDRRNADMIAAPLRKDGFSVTIAEDGKQALDHLRRESYDVLITDWMMPRMDGIALILRVRETVQPMPYIIMVTALNSRKARAHALDSGADDFLSKPISGRRVLRSVRTGLARCRQPAPEMKPQPSGASFAPAAPPPFVGLVIAASTGGPGALPRILGALPRRERAAGFIVQHAPTWMLESLAARLQPSCPLRIVLARDGLPCSPGDIYLAPGDRHMLLDPDGLIIRLTQDPPENFVRPAADPLFRSAAAAFGRFCVGVVLTGMGRDGTVGAGAVTRAGGIILVQDPATATAPSMPKTAIESGMVSAVCTLDEIGERVAREVEQLAHELPRHGAGRGA